MSPVDIWRNISAFIIYLFIYLFIYLLFLSNRLRLDHVLIDHYVLINIYWILPNMDCRNHLDLSL